jgi:putative transposase
MPNHVHLVAVPGEQESLRRAIGETHRQYTLRINSREGWKGYLWQGRFSSYPMDEKHLLAAVRYIELNPVRAGLVDDPMKWPWSSARLHFAGQSDGFIELEPLVSIAGNWSDFLGRSVAEAEKLRKHQSTGRPLGNDDFIETCENLFGKTPQTAQARAERFGRVQGLR